jgi:hypothetical protein
LGAVPSSPLLSTDTPRKKRSDARALLPDSMTGAASEAGRDFCGVAPSGCVLLRMHGQPRLDTVWS